MSFILLGLFPYTLKNISKLYEKKKLVNSSSVGTWAIHPSYNYNLQNMHQYSIHENWNKNMLLSTLASRWNFMIFW